MLTKAAFIFSKILYGKMIVFYLKKKIMYFFHVKAKLNSQQLLLDFLVSHEIKFKFNILYIIISVENSCGAQYFLVISFVTGINYILGKSYFKGVIWCNFTFSFLFGGLQADCA